MSVFCNKDGCGVSWPRHPALEVACPDCKSKAGTKCRRPSGHSTSDFHRSRRVLAEEGGHFGCCPQGICFEDPETLAREQAKYDANIDGGAMKTAPELPLFS